MFGCVQCPKHCGRTPTHSWPWSCWRTARWLWWAGSRVSFSQRTSSISSPSSWMPTKHIWCQSALSGMKRQYNYTRKQDMRHFISVFVIYIRKLGQNVTMLMIKQLSSFSGSWLKTCKMWKCYTLKTSLRSVFKGGLALRVFSLWKPKIRKRFEVVNKIWLH